MAWGLSWRALGVYSNCVALILYGWGISTNSWMEFDHGESGLWFTCNKNTSFSDGTTDTSDSDSDDPKCSNLGVSVEDYLHGTRALMVIGALCYIMGFTIGTNYHRRLTDERKIRRGGIFNLCGALLGWFGLWLYNRGYDDDDENYPNSKLYWSFLLCTVGVYLTLVTSLLLAGPMLEKTLDNRYDKERGQGLFMKCYGCLTNRKTVAVTSANQTNNQTPPHERRRSQEMTSFTAGQGRNRQSSLDMGLTEQEPVRINGVSRRDSDNRIIFVSDSMCSAISGRHGLHSGASSNSTNNNNEVPITEPLSAPPYDLYGYRSPPPAYDSCIMNDTPNAHSHSITIVNSSSDLTTESVVTPETARISSVTTNSSEIAHTAGATSVTTNSSSIIHAEANNSYRDWNASTTTDNTSMSTHSVVNTHPVDSRNSHSPPPSYPGLFEEYPPPPAYEEVINMERIFQNNITTV